MSVFVTVGSTGFDELVRVATSMDMVSALESLGYTALIVQYGQSEAVYHANVKMIEERTRSFDIRGYAYKPSIEDDMKNAALIISHAGSGSILQALRLPRDNGKTRLIVVSNPSLMDDHQSELAATMEAAHYCMACTPSQLVNRVNEAARFETVPFPQANTMAFAELLDKYMGFE